ncbi:transcription elongation factor A N-terminal and central domain-containing protein 2 [Spea bombifrons]|uniref:transcription elongation factor A N-terminal and central domain-containing protein 2 n=1 Tax=Spea bombifrons TaxID=233779 RepID=UPI00234B7A08|nr:transcription elongation factor A N-terminal and central domain-containing protein 2 [Spea bombifrons]
MDKFVIRNPKLQEPGGKIPCKEKRAAGQATLYSLKRVVVLEDIMRWKCILELPNQTSKKLLRTLQELQKKIPSEEVIRSTKIGEAVENLQKHSDGEVSDLAREVHTQWDTFIKEKRCKPNIEVRSDAATEKLRLNARRLLAESLLVEADDSLVECIEREVFYQSSRLINVHYRRTVRALVFALKHKPEVRSKVRDGATPVEELVRSHKK